MASAFLHVHRRRKNGKEHCYWSIAEKVRVSRGRWVQRQLLYLGDINDSQRAAWTKLVEVFDTAADRTAELALYPAGRDVPDHAAEYGVQVCLKDFRLRRPRQWGACWIGCRLWEQLQLDAFWAERLSDSREGTCWRHVLQTLVINQLVDPGSEWRLHRQWFHDSALADLLDEDFALVEKDTLYPRLDRGIPTEEVLAEMRASDPPVSYLVGTPKGRLTRYEQELQKRPWHEVREGVTVNLLPQEGEVYVLAESRDRVCKERAMRRRQLKGLWARLKELRDKELKRDDLLVKLGSAGHQFPAGWRLVKVTVSEDDPRTGRPSLAFTLRRQKLREVRRREGRYLLRSNLPAEDPARLWQFYIQLTQVEAAFKDLKRDVGLRPIFHQLERRIEAHVFVAFLAYCLHVSLRHQLRAKAPGLTPRAVLEKFAAIQMLDVHFPTTDGRELVFQRYTQPERDHRMLLAQLEWELPSNRHLASPPKAKCCATELRHDRRFGADLSDAWPHFQPLAHLRLVQLRKSG